MFQDLVLKELIKNGYSKERGKRVWNIASHKLLYMTPRLAQGFLDLERFPRYKANVVDRELGLIRAYTFPFFEGLHGDINVIDFGCGDGSKAESFVKSLPSSLKTKYFAVDVSLPLAHLAKMKLQKLRSSLFTFGGTFLEDFSSPESILRRIRKKSSSRNILLLLGSSLASFQVNDFLFHMGKSMKTGEVLVIGNGIRTGKRFVGVDKYRHPAFNEWFISLMDALGFTSDEVQYDVRFAHGRLEFFYHVKKDKVFVCSGKRIKFTKGDEIVVAVQYKYYARELEEFCKMYFPYVKFFKDKDDEYALIFCVK